MLIELSRSVFRPGQEKMYSTSTAPANIPPICRPTTVTMGKRAFRRTWCQATMGSVRPLARAVRT